MEILGDYHDIDTYLKTGFLILAGVSDNFRKVCKEHSTLEACRLIISPALSWDALISRINMKSPLL